MKVIEKTEFNKVDVIPSVDEENDENHPISEITEEKFEKLIEQMSNPVSAQKQLAVQIKLFLDRRIRKELTEKGILSDHTRRWVEQFNKILDSIQKSLYGDKSVNLHVHKVTHSAIAAKMRESK